VLAASDLDKHISMPWPDDVLVILQSWITTEEALGF